eukprot:5165350-Pyramimonas_sp.AAC.1
MHPKINLLVESTDKKGTNRARSIHGALHALSADSKGENNPGRNQFCTVGPDKWLDPASSR